MVQIVSEHRVLIQATKVQQVSSGCIISVLWSWSPPSLLLSSASAPQNCRPQTEGLGVGGMTDAGGAIYLPTIILFLPSFYSTSSSRAYFDREQ